MKKNRKKHTALWVTLLCLLCASAAAAFIFMRFGGFGTGESADAGELAACAGSVADIAVPDNVRVIALGEASHGNAEFQQLKLDVFKVMVERYGVRAFALEGDYGGCEQVNRYIHGGDGTAQEAAAAIGFAIYRTEEMAALISYMRSYNDAAAPGEDLRFYGFDMQRYTYSLGFLLEACRTLDVDTGALERLMDGEEWSAGFDSAARTDCLTALRAQLEGRNADAQTLHLVDMLLQNLKLGEGTGEGYADLRDSFMADSVRWISAQEAALGHSRIFISGHNGHVARMGYDNMGKLLCDTLGGDYYVIGTDFCRTRCNMPTGACKRTEQVFYSHDPLANGAKEAGLALCWLDFSKVSPDSALGKYVFDYTYMGSLGEGYAFYMRLLPPSYRIFQTPAALFDGMIFVADATPTKILDAA